ncbi:MAG: hypothetical protein AAGJ28_17060 [Pseudomonadota bacterium]
MSDYYDLGPYSRTITAANEDAQIWFDRGLNWTYGFHHEEAIKCFKTAVEHDPGCAMAHWGIAYATGPNYNLPWHLMDPKGKARTLAKAYDAMQDALANMDGITAPERALIEALQARYPEREPVEDMRPWDIAYAEAMRTVHKASPEDLDLRSVFVEAMMNCTPWRMWDLKTGGPGKYAMTDEAVAVLDEAFAGQAAWDHPGLLHLHVHLMEMSPFPQKALRTGDRLRTMMPDAGHIVHMPTHIDVLCGNYHDVLTWNLKAIEADHKSVERDGAMNFYTLYRVHNHHFAIYGAMFLGQFGPALAAAEDMEASIPEDLLRMESPPMANFLESSFGMKPHVLVRFGKWQEIIDTKLPVDQELYCVTTTTWHYAKGVAHAALGQIAEAEAEQALFRKLRATVPEDRRRHNNTCQDIFNVAEEMLAGEIAYRKGDYEAAYAHLRQSVWEDDNLLYDEPWGWMQPTRHALGALLLEQGHVDEAEAVYRADLGLDGQLSRACQHPDNPWALHGLLECLNRRGETAEAAIIGQRLELAGARADVPITASCFCRMDRAA